MKKILQLIRPFRETRNIVALCLALFLSVGSAWAQTTHTIGWGTASGDAGTYTNFTAASGSVSGVCTFEAVKNEASTAPAYNANSSELRLYYASSGQGGSIIITPAAGVTITGAVVTTSTTPSVVYYIDEGDPISVSVSENTYTISDISATSSLEIQNANTTNTQLRIKTIALTYTISGTQPTTYTVTFNAGEGTFQGNSDFPTTNSTKTAGTYTLPSAERSGYTFDGWMITGDSQLYTDSYTVSDDVDFTAQYTESTTPDDELTLTFNLSSNPGSWPTTSSTTLTNYTYTLNGVDYTFALKNVKCNSGYLMIYSVGAVGLPAIDGYKLTKVVAKNSGGCSTSTKVGISSSASSESYIDGGGIQTWSTTSSSYTYNLTSTEENTMYYLYVTNKNAQVTELALTYEAATTPTVAAPTFDPVSGTEFGDEGLSVTISCTTEGASIYYTLDGSTPDNQSTLYDGAISLTETTTIKAIAYDGDNASNVATATYTYIDPNAPGTLNNPYTVAQARAAIDANSGTQGVYATGIVSEVVSYNNNYHSITYWISDDGTTTNQLEAYGGISGIAGWTFSSVDDIEVGATVVIYGNLKKYNSTYEFDLNNELVSYTAPIHAVEAPTFSPAAGTYDEPQTVTLSCATDGVSIYYTIDGTEPTNESMLYETPITVETTTTIKAIAYLDEEHSTVATATYHINSAENPYTVTQALNFSEYPANGIYVSGIVSTAPTQTPTSNGELTYFISADGTATSELEVYKGKGLEQAAFAAQNDIQVGDIVTIYGNVVIFGTSNPIKEFAQGNYLVSFERPATPSITVSPATVEAPAEGAEGSLTVSIENILDVISVDLSFCDANGGELEADPDWIYAEVVEPTPTEGYTVSYTVYPNDGEARTAYFKVCSGDVCSDIVTVNQAAYVAPPQDYAELPFEFDGGKADIDITDGLTHDGLGSDYNNSPKLRFDDSGDWLVLHFNQVPGELSYSIKGNGFSGSTFTVQTSEDGDTYENLKTYTELGSSILNETFRNIGENVRYIKWIYTNKSSGNVALGNIKLALPSTEPLILVEQDLIEVGYEGGGDNISVTYENMGDEPQVDVAFFAEDGETPASYSWVSAEINDNNGVFYLVEANEGETRTAYMKVYDVNNTTITSNLITITQAAAPQQYELTVSDFENLEIFTFVDNTDELALEGAGSIMVSENATISLSVSADEGYVLSSLMVDGHNVLSQLDETGLYTFAMPAHNVTVTATAIEFVPGEWVLTSLADLTENDVFVIVGTDEDEDATYALPNDGNSSAPVATPIVVVDGTLAGEPAVNLKWNLGGNATDGYTFYPNGDTENWLYCSTTANTGSNNNIKVGHGDNTRNVFVLDEDGYLITNDSNVTRYLSIYFNNGVAQDWRGYVNNTNALPISFYKKVTAVEECTVVLGETESFENYTESTELRTGVLPDCWTVAHHYTALDPDTVAMVYRSFASEGSYSLRLHHRGIVAMPALPADVDINLLKLDMVVRQPQTFYSLQVGVMTSLEDESTFVPVALCNNPTTGKLPFECNFASYVAPEDYEGPFYIAFKNIGIAETDPHSVNYLDEVVVDYLDEEEIPSCAITELTYTEYFNDLLIADDGRLVPECWTLPEEFNSIPTQYKPQLYNSFAHTGSYSLKMRDFCVYAMPKYAVPNTPITDVKMTFWLRQAHKAYQLEVGVMTDANDANTFVPVQLIDNETTGKELVEVSFANYTGPVEGDLYIAFRNKGQTSSWTYSYNYIDDIEIAPINRSASAWNTDELDAMDADSYLDNIVVYPNPTTGNLYIDAMDVQKVECFNQMGQLVGVYDNANELNISDLSNGVYMLRITVPQGVTMRKVVKR